MKLKLFLAKVFILCFFLPYIGVFIHLWSSGHKVLALIWVLVAAAAVVAIEEAFKAIKRKIKGR